MKPMQKIVIKLGSSSLMQGTQQLSPRYMLGLVQQIAQLKARGFELVLVSSGAIATGRGLFKNSTDRQILPSKQSFASLGQVKLMQMWMELFSLLDLHAGQVLLTKSDFSSSQKVHTKETICCLVQHGIIPIINENDAIAQKETRIGDNDNLAALVAHLIGADKIILLTDQEGLYTSDPRLNVNAQFISTVTHIDEAILTLGSGPSSSLGTGGMVTKIQAAQMASRAGIRTIIASADRSNILIDLAEGKHIGTHFLENPDVVGQKHSEHDLSEV